MSSTEIKNPESELVLHMASDRKVILESPVCNTFISTNVDVQPDFDNW